MTQQTVLPTVCALDCPDACALHVTIENGRVTRVTGDKSHPMTQGFACVKTVRYPERQNHPDRLTDPLIRVGPKGSGQFRKASWDTVLDEIASKLKGLISQFGGDSILPYSYAGTMGLVERDHPLAFFRALGATELDWTICAATGSAGWEMAYGPDKLSTAPEDVAHAGLIILWGVNVVRSNSHLIPWIKQAKRRGATVWHIDPYRNETTKLADHYLPIQVGTDAALALALGGEIIRNGREDREFLAQYGSGLDEYRDACREWPLSKAAEFCDVPLEQLEQLAQQIGDTRNSFFRVGYGMTRNEGGGNAMLAISLLPALIGAWQHLGGGGMLSTSGAFRLNTSRASGLHLLQTGVRHVNQNQLGQALLSSEPPIRSLFVFNSNPAAVAPDTQAVLAGLRRDDLLTVVLEHFQTDTADYADYLLPATTFLEHPDIYTAYGHYYLQWAEPVVQAVGQARPNSWVFSQLAQRLGLADESLYWSTEQVAASLLETDHAHLSGITFERLKQERSIRLSLPESFRAYADGSHFADHRIRFGSPIPKQVVFEETTSTEFPFRMISPPGSHMVNTTMGNIQSLLNQVGGEPSIIMNSLDAQSIGCATKDLVVIRSQQGEIVRRLQVSDATRPGVVIAVGLWWPKLSPDRRGLNQLTSQRLTDYGGGSCFGNAVVRISKAPSL